MTNFLDDELFGIGEPRTIIFDCDGPLNMFDEHFLKIARPHTTQQELLDLGDWDYFKLLSREETAEAFRVLATDEYWETIPPRPSAIATVGELRNKGHNIIFCTAPWEGCKKWDHIRRKWLKKHFDAKGKEDIIITAAKEYVCGDFFIDDKPENVLKWNKRWLSKGFKSFLFETLSNKNDRSAKDLWPRIRVIDGKWEIVSK